MLSNAMVRFAAPMELPSEVAFMLGDTQVYWAGILFAAAILAAILFTGIEARLKRLPEDTVVDLCIVLIPCGIVGARVWYVLSHLDGFSGNALSALRFWDGGLSIYGAILFATLGLLIYTKIKKLSLPRLLDALAPGLVLSQAILLWSDFFTQRGFGAEVIDPNLAWFPLCVLIRRTDTIHLAVFFFEFLWCILILALVLSRIRKRFCRDGAAFLRVVLLDGVGHAVFNAMRVDCQAIWGPLDAVGGICLFAAAIALVLLAFIRFGALPVAMQCEADGSEPNNSNDSVAHEPVLPTPVSDEAVLTDAVTDGGGAAKGSERDSIGDACASTVPADAQSDTL